MGKSTYGMGSVVLRGKKWYGYPRIQRKNPAKATQGLMRHARMATTTDVYQKVIPEAVAEMADAIHEELRKPSTAAVQTGVIAAQLRAGKQNRRRRQPKIDTKIDTN